MTVKQPVKNGIAKTPVVMQLEALECGAACLTMVLAYYEKWIPLEQVRSDCGVSRDGSNAGNILKAARNYGLEASGFKFEVDAIKEYGVFPCIIHWNFNHFVVLKGFKRDYAYINDPARGEVKIPMEEFSKSFTGVVLLFRPGENFEPSGKKKTVFDYLKERTGSFATASLFVILTTCISSLIGIIQPGFTKMLYDRLLPGINPDLVGAFFKGLIILSVLQIIIQWVTDINNLKINGKIAVVGSTSFMWKVLKLPMTFFSQRMVGDILTRENSNEHIANTIVKTMAPLFLDVIMMVLYFIVMIRYNVTLTAVALVSTVVNLIVSQIITKKRINATRLNVRASGKLSGATVSGIEMIETLKASGAENGFFESWAGYQANANDGTVEYQKTSNYLGLIPSIVSSLCSTTILAIGLYLTIKGEFTLGAISAFQAYLTSFLAPTNTLISAGQTLQEMITEMERIDDVMNYPDDEVFSAPELSSTDEHAKLSGEIVMNNVTFGYSKLANPLIKDFNLHIKPGDKIAFVGGSGCGKSTLSKLISGLEKPWSGEILFDGKPVTEIDRNIFTASVAVVDQDIILFEDTVMNNLKMWDTTIADFEVYLAARDAQIHEDILKRDKGYEHVLTEGGKDFSGGQRQRLEIARVLAQDPTICILDEATSALDAKTEYDVIQSIKQRGITTIVVAHRLSTIRDCEEIIVLDKGEVVERGNHKELMELNGYYANLISKE